VLLDWPWQQVVLLDAFAWGVISIVAGWRGRTLEPAALARDRAVLRLAPFERTGGGAWYRHRLRIHRWKDRLPDAGPLFGGQSKRHLPGRSAGSRTARLGSFSLECRRAELVHWWILGSTPLFALWNSPGLFAAMVVYAVALNVPCIAVLRYNRVRLWGMFTPERGEPAPAPPAAR